VTINSRAKGARAERELAEYIRSFGFAARRGQQFSGSADSPDVVTDIEGVHFESKRVEKGSIYPWLAQAKRDAGDKIPVVAHRRNGEEWIAILPLKHLMELLRGRETGVQQLLPSDPTRSAEGPHSCAIGMVAAARRRTARRSVQQRVPE
jgi:Holliday junction resolvase